MRISFLSILCIAVSAAVSFAFPVFLFAVFRKKYGARIRPALAGAAVFVVFALVLEQILHFFVLRSVRPAETPFLYILYGILMAGIFEESGRFFAFTLMKKRYGECAPVSAALSYGVGHGGIEAILFGGLVMINNLAAAARINAGTIDTLTGRLEGASLARAESQMRALITTPPWHFLMGGLERVSAMGIHIALSVMVFYAVFGKKRFRLFPLAVLLHAMVTIPAAAMQAGILDRILPVEITVFVLAGALVFLARFIHRQCKNDLPQGGAD
ncbi:MAG: YhfC family intramembrane metalloprotease [Spirochaetaceae bacterium]|jgi:uncharacterized membrane protein YhfC|nr:YhfC family intramembrane metalloprotease [Spirochaetaceae bacterium]